MINDQLAALKVDRLRTFLAVVRHGSFSAAAAALFLPQPRVSQHVADLERLFGARLFDRSRQPVTLTEAGSQLLPHVQTVIDSLAAAVRDLDCGGGPLGGTVVVGMYPSAAAHFYGELVRDVKGSHPGVEIVLWEGATLEIGTALAAGDVDLAIRPCLPAPEHTERLAWETLWVEPLVAVLPADSGLQAPTGAIDIAQLGSQSLITIGASHGPSERLAGFDCTEALAAAGLADLVAYQTNQPQTLVGMVRSGLGVGITNQLAVTTSNCAGVQVVPLTGEGCSREVALWWRTRVPLSASVDAVAEAYRTVSELTVGNAHHPREE